MLRLCKNNFTVFTLNFGHFMIVTTILIPKFERSDIQCSRVPNYSSRSDYASSVDPDQTAPTGAV